MGKIQIITKEQQVVLDEVKKDPFVQRFYFTGGTALSAFYLQHRYSEDLDFFTDNKFDQNTLLRIVDLWSKKHSFTFTSEFHEVVYVFMLKFHHHVELKVDFGYYPYRRIEKDHVIEGLKTDSLIDIAVNKLLTITQRNDVKDFVDLYFLLKTFTLWDLLEGIRIKFKMKIEPFLLASDFLKVEDFDYLPRMITPLNIQELKLFYRQKAKELGAKSVKK